MTDSDHRSLGDSAERWTAITTPEHAFVWASAGTGKTHTLTLRALYLLLDAPFLPLDGARRPRAFEHIALLYATPDRRERLASARAALRSLVLMTFTRKAAAEMAARLYRYLDSISRASSVPDLEATHADSLFLALVNLVAQHVSEQLGLDDRQAFERLRGGAEALAELAIELPIVTIHSFAASLLRRHPLQARLPSNVRFQEEDGERVRLSETVVDLWWRRRVLGDPTLQERLSQVLETARLDQLREWLHETYARPWLLEEVDDLEHTDDAQVDAALRACRSLADALARARGDVVQDTRKRLSAALTDIQAGTPGAWSSLWSIIHERSAQLFLEAASTQGVRKAVESLPAGERRFFESSAALELLALGRCLADPGMNAWRTWREVLREFTEWSRDAALRELGLVSFDDMIRLAADLVESHAAVRRAERSRLRAILVDEFQDTDPEQLRLLQALLQADREDGHEVLGFFVGDIKQSIYRFRGADVPSIRAFRDRYRELTGCSRDCVELRLTANFRSVLDVTDFVNDLFHQTLPLAGPEEWLQPRRSERIGPPVWIWIRSDASGQRLKAAQARRAAAFETARLVTTYLAEQPDGGASYSNILVLVNKGSELDIVVNALQQAGIPVVSSGTRTLYQHPEVLDLINLLITLHNPLDTLATAAVLRSPLVSLSDPDIFRLLKETPASELFHGARSLPAFVPKPAVERVEAVRRLWRDRETLPSWKWLQEVYAFLPLAAYSDPQDREGRALVRVQRVLNDFQAEGLSGATPPLVWLLERRARAEQVGRYDADLGEDVSVADERVDAVRVMTIHKAKGLEARCVILAGWAGTLGGIESPNRVGKPAVIRETQADGESRAAFRLEWGNLTVRSRHYAELMRQYEKREKEEAVRLSYVAATRACDRLSMVCALSVRGRLPESVTALESALEAPSTERQGVSVLDGRLVLLRKTADESLPALFSSSAVELDLTTYRRLWEGRYQGLATPGPPPFRRPSQTEFPPDPEEPPSALAASPGGKDVHMAAGDLVHRYLERYLQDENFDPARLERLARAVDGGASRPASDLAERILRRFFSGRLAGPDGRPFTERARVGRVLAREFPVYLNIEGESWLGVIDLVLEEGGVVKAVDYKTTTVKAILPASYEQQRRIYSEALRRLFPGRQVEFEFWWLNGGGGSSLA